MKREGEHKARAQVCYVSRSVLFHRQGEELWENFSQGNDVMFDLRKMTPAVTYRVGWKGEGSSVIALHVDTIIIEKY